MDSSLIILILMIAVTIVLVAGLVLMAIGGKINKKYANKLMIARVSLQFLAIIGVLLIFMLR